MRAVECAACGNQVLCEKFSVAHTSVQWTADAAVACAEFRDRVRPGVTTARMRTCGALRASIARAIEGGTLTIGILEPGFPGPVGLGPGFPAPGSLQSGTPGPGAPGPGITPEAADA